MSGLIKKNIIKSKILNACHATNNKIFARNCVYKTIAFDEKKAFLNNHHLQGNDCSEFNFGLYHNEELVSVMTFCKPRLALGNKTEKKNMLELSRFCSKSGTNIIGGFEKLFKNSIKTFNGVEKIITYSDCRFSGINHESTVYFKSKFNFIHLTKPNYFYVFKKDYLTRYHRFAYNKQKLIKIFNADKSKTEWQIAQENNMDRLWDCGSMKFEYEII